MRVVIRRLAPAVAAMCLAACAAAPVPVAAPGDAASLSLRMNETARVPGSELRVTFLEARDDRCPQGVQCIVAGSVRATLRVELASRQALVSVAWPEPSARASALPGNAFGHTFCFTSLEPRARAGRPVPPDDLVLAFSIREAGQAVAACGSTATAM